MAYSEERLHADQTVSHLYESGYLHGVSEPAKRETDCSTDHFPFSSEFLRYQRGEHH